MALKENSQSEPGKNQAGQSSDQNQSQTTLSARELLKISEEQAESVTGADALNRFEIIGAPQPASKPRISAANPYAESEINAAGLGDREIKTRELEISEDEFAAASAAPARGSNGAAASSGTRELDIAADEFSAAQRSGHNSQLYSHIVIKHEKRGSSKQSSEKRRSAGDEFVVPP